MNNEHAHKLLYLYFMCIDVQLQQFQARLGLWNTYLEPLASSIFYILNIDLVPVLPFSRTNTTTIQKKNFFLTLHVQYYLHYSQHQHFLQTF